MMESLIKDRNEELENKVTLLSEHLKGFINEIKMLKNENKSLLSKIDSCVSAVTNLQNQTYFMN